MRIEEKRSNFVKWLVDEMLKPFNSSYQQVVAEPIIDGQSWFDYYTWSKEESDTFKNMAIKEMQKRFKYSKKYCENEIDWFLFNYGLRVK